MNLRNLLNSFHSIERESRLIGAEEHVDLILKYRRGSREENIKEAKESIPRIRRFCVKFKINCVNPSYEQIKRVSDFVDSRAQLIYS